MSIPMCRAASVPGRHAASGGFAPANEPQVNRFARRRHRLRVEPVFMNRYPSSGHLFVGVHIGRWNVLVGTDDDHHSLV
jgi:hypothetical protein